MATKYFKKENIRTEVRDGLNKIISFIPVFGGDGVLALDEENDNAAISALESLVDRRVGGVAKISSEIYESLKKNEALTPSPRPSMFNGVRVSPSPTSFAPRVAATPVAATEAKITVMPEPPPPATIGKFQPRSRPVNPK